MRGLIAIGVGILVIVAVSVAAVAVAGSRGPASFPPDSPQAVIQEYVVALESGDYDAAYALFSESVQAEMSREDFEASIEEQVEYSVGVTRTAYFDRVEISGDSATVHLTVEDVFSDGGIGGAPYSYPVQIRMVNENDAWRIDEPLTGLDPFSQPKSPF